jgi:hypothetical protein
MKMKDIAEARNPVVAGLCATPEAWPWSSASAAGSVSGSAGVPAGISSTADEDVGAPRDAGAPMTVGASIKHKLTRCFCPA